MLVTHTQTHTVSLSHCSYPATVANPLRFTIPFAELPRHQQSDGGTALDAEGALPASEATAATASEPERGLSDAQHLRPRKW